MSELKTIPLNYNVIEEVYDFNLVPFPDEMFMPLVNALRSEYQLRLQKAAAPAFRAERALQQERYEKECLLNGTYPRQIFIDFPVN